jgi:hypothetical protein
MGPAALACARDIVCAAQADQRWAVIEPYLVGGAAALFVFLLGVWVAAALAGMGRARK